MKVIKNLSNFNFNNKISSSNPLTQTRVICQFKPNRLILFKFINSRSFSSSLSSSPGSNDIHQTKVDVLVVIIVVVSALSSISNISQDKLFQKDLSTKKEAISIITLDNLLFCLAQ
ncbi:hypothetical protein ACTA71_007666 [Dictyostelium dimigraforme]